MGQEWTDATVADDGKISSRGLREAIWCALERRYSTSFGCWGRHAYPRSGDGEEQYQGICSKATTKPARPWRCSPAPRTVLSEPAKGISTGMSPSVDSRVAIIEVGVSTEVEDQRDGGDCGDGV